jgi:hypothetical protein
MSLKGITSQKAHIFNTKISDAREFTPAQSIHFTESGNPCVVMLSFDHFAFQVFKREAVIVTATEVHGHPTLTSYVLGEPHREQRLGKIAV